MKILFCIHTPAHVHLFKNIIVNLQKNGHKVKILARDYGSTLSLLNDYGFQYDIYIKQSNRLKSLKILQIFPYVFHEYKLARRFKPDIIIGIGTDEPLFATLLRKPCIIFSDSEPIPFQHFLDKIFAKVIVTPSCFNKDLGNKQVRIAGYKELAYLHPNYFKPEPSILDELGLTKNEKYVLLRFNVFDAFHDVGKHGFSLSDQFQLVSALEKYSRVFISPEGQLAKELERYRLPVPFHRIHHVLYYAQLLVTDTQTMTTEAAILGTPVVRCNNWVGPNDMGNFIELEQKYDLIYSYNNSKLAIQKAIDLITKPGLKEEWARKMERLINEKIDVTKFMVDFIKNYPESFTEYKRKND